MKNITTELQFLHMRLEEELSKENPNYRIVNFYQSMIRSLKETYIQEPLSK
jgi:hypothetical protein